MLRPPRCCLKVSVVQTRVCTMPFCVISGCLCDSHRPSQRGQGRCPPVSHCSVPRRLCLRPRCAGGCRNRQTRATTTPFFFKHNFSSGSFGACLPPWADAGEVSSSVLAALVSEYSATSSKWVTARFCLGHSSITSCPPSGLFPAPWSFRSPGAWK